MTEEVRKLAQFFLKKYPLEVKERHIKMPPYKDYYDMPFSAVLGGQCHSLNDLMDKILLANSILDNATTIYLVGEVGVAAAAALDVQVSRVERFPTIDAQKREYQEVKPFFVRLFEKAAEQNVSVKIPADFVTAPMLDIRGGQVLSVPGTQESKIDETEGGSKGSKLRAGKDSQLQVERAAEDQQQESIPKEVSNDVERAILAQNPNLHWSDVMIQSEKSNIINLREHIQARMNLLSAEYLAKNDGGRPLSSKLTTGPITAGELPKLTPLSPSMAQDNSAAQIIETNREDVEDDNEENKTGDAATEEQPLPTAMSPDEVVLQYGPETMSELVSLLKQSFKVFWDGSISLYKDTVSSSTNNKDFLNKLLDVRMASDQHQEPPVTLIHGHETEITLRETLMRIKVEQAEELERMKQKQLEQDELSEAEDDIGDLEESKEEISTFQEDMDTIADFLVSDATPFTTKLLQGVPIRALYSFDEHRKQSLDEQKEALDLLELI